MLVEVPALQRVGLDDPQGPFQLYSSLIYRGCAKGFHSSWPCVFQGVREPPSCHAMERDFSKESGPPFLSFSQLPVTFEDVAVYFSPEEWPLLTDWQRDLYYDVMQGNFELVASLAVPPRPELLSRIERGEEPGIVGRPGQGDRDTQGGASSGESRMSWPELAMKEEPRGDWNPPASPPWSLSGPQFLALQELCPTWCQVELTNIRSLAQEGPLETGALQEPQLLICGDCGRSFEDGGSLADHQATHEEQKGPFACSSCGKLFLYRLNLLTHKRHRAKPQLACAACGLRFCLKGDLLRHRASHAAKELYPCGTCGEVFQRKAHLLAHEAVEHAGRAGRDCPECGEAVGGEAELAQHLAAHHEERRPFACALCPETFSWKEGLRLHQRAHAQEGGHRCPDCGKSFSRRGNLLTHQRLHTGDLPFACSECGRAFPTNVALVAHSKMHLRGKTFACQQCGGCFRSREKLLQHQSHHNGRPEEDGVKEEGEA
ncbi:finger 2-like isoform X3 [Podarcis lilfordi]|uniref:Finger 2-like isoform X3 n=1 Tax=Podarcis lilfordi TaxID=74358 RepID=A0AA35L3Z0_9SAUR|nr:finger 2-like isoform X3 [Podarcis lilfordi]